MAYNDNLIKYGGFKCDDGKKKKKKKKNYEEQQKQRYIRIIDRNVELNLELWGRRERRNNNNNNTEVRRNLT